LIYNIHIQNLLKLKDICPYFSASTIFKLYMYKDKNIYYSQNKNKCFSNFQTLIINDICRYGHFGTVDSYSGFLCEISWRSIGLLHQLCKCRVCKKDHAHGIYLRAILVSPTSSALPRSSTSRGTLEYFYKSLGSREMLEAEKKVRHD